MTIFCSRLRELSLLYCQKIGNDALYEVGRGCKDLQALHLVDCTSIGDEAICGIAAGCRNLKKLHIRRCYEVLHLPSSFFTPFKHYHDYVVVISFVNVLAFNVFVCPSSSRNIVYICCWQSCQNLRMWIFFSLYIVLLLAY